MNMIKQHCVYALFLTLGLIAPNTVFGEDLKPGEVTISIKGKSALASVVYADEQSLKDTPVVLIVHGTLAHKDMDFVKAQSDLLAERGVNVVALSLTLGQDNRRGLYDCAVPHTHRHDDALVEINAWLDWLSSQGAGPITLMGHSRGGAQAALYMAEVKDSRVRSLVLAAPMTYAADRVTTGFEKNHKRALSEALNEMAALEQSGQGDDLVSGLGLLYCPGAAVTPKSFLNYYGVGVERRDTPTILERISVPTLVAVASHDQVVPDLPDRLKNRSYQGTRVVTIEDAGHMFLDFAGEDLADAVDAFIQEITLAQQGG